MAVKRTTIKKFPLLKPLQVILDSWALGNVTKARPMAEKMIMAVGV